MKKLSFIVTLIFICFVQIFGQIPTFEIHRPANFPSYNNVGAPRNNFPQPTVPSLNNTQQGADAYQQDMQAEQQRRIYQENLLRNQIVWKLPSHSHLSGAQYFYTAAQMLVDILSGEKPINLKEAVFIVENAWFEGKLNYDTYNKAILNLISIAQLKAKQDKLNWNDPITKNVMLFRVMVDTLSIKLPNKEGKSLSYPMRYDFEDFRGEEDFSKMFVSKLLTTHSGQCHSLPLLYVILCEEVGTKASIAFSPLHCYAKFKDKNENWHNLELTQGAMVSDAFVVASGFVNAASIKNGLYTQAQTPQQQIAHCLNDLITEYIYKYDYDPFVIQYVDTVLKYAPAHPTAIANKSNYKTLYFDFLYQQVGYPDLDYLKTKYPRIYAAKEDRDSFYQYMDDIGYQEIPPDKYEEWLKSVNEEKEKQAQQKFNQILKIIK